MSRSDNHHRYPDCAHHVDCFVAASRWKAHRFEFSSLSLAVIRTCHLIAHNRRSTGASNAFSKRARIAGEAYAIQIERILLIYLDRRKKAKCSGERPVCGCCKRLNQDCQWESAAASRSNAESDMQESVGSSSDQGTLVPDVTEANILHLL